MASIHWALLLFLVQLPILATSRAHSNGNHTLWCHQDQAAALLQLKQSFSAAAITATLLPSWENGTNCCIWKGISCDASSGLVTVLDLSGHGLNSYGLDPALFSLRSLQRLDLSMNSLGDYSYNIYWHQKFERLSSLTHLNLSNSGLDGPIPIGISKLVNLVSLDLSSHTVFSDDDPISTADSFNHLWEPNFETLVGNLNNLRELYLDKLQIMSSSGEDWGKALAKYVPNLQVLSLSGCGLNGPIHHSLSSLQSLVAINLGSNDVGPIPEFFADFPNLSELQLSHMNLQGWFPQRFFQLKNLRVLDLSSNPNLSGHLPNFPHASSIHTLRLEGTNFSYAKPSSSGDFKLLRELTIDGKFLSMDFLSSFGVLGSLCQLKVDLMDSQNDLGPIFSWIGDLRNLASLDIYRCDFSWTTPSSIGNLKALRSLKMFDCNLPRPILSEIGNLINLQKLEISGTDDCKLHGSVTSSIGNLTNLRSLYMVNCHYCGAIPAAIGYLRNLRRLAIYSCDFTGALPSAVGNLTNLKSMVISSSQLSGPIPYAIGQLKELTQLTIESGNISGRIPSSLLNLTRLAELDLSYNHMSGHILAPLFALPKLSYLNLRLNQFSGPIEEFDAPSSCLQVVRMSRNLLAGQFPKSFFQLAELLLLEINENNFVDNVIWNHQSGGYFSSLQILDLALNNFSGKMNSEWFGQLKSMMANFNGSGDIVRATNLHGMAEYYQDSTEISYKGSDVTFGRILTTLTAIDLSNNRLEGNIPESVGRLVSLRVLNMSHNAFTGKIPTQLGGVTDLESLDLSCNQLSGEIPQELTSLTFLAILNLSDNRLMGKIPQSRQFSTFDSNSFKGNLGLCGPPFSTPCGVSLAPPSVARAEKSSDVDVILFLFAGLGFGVGFAAAIL
ncbi:LRR receptor-like serine/threonine-protein kinase FLS2 [Hordeum vulgare]|nr:LRR receptor-like serine/threonine-protein kinase FLS2 [Hordeum vulgare]